MKTYLFLILAIFCTYVSSGTIDPGTLDSKYIEYGSKFKCVVRICGKSKEGLNYCASAVVVNKHWIITAAHVVKDCVSVKIKDFKDKEYCVTKVIVHEDYHEDNFGHNDIAVGYVEEEINSDFYPELYSDSDEVGKVCAIAGYGITGTFSTGTHTSDSNKRGGSNKIDKIDRQLLICSPSRPGASDKTSLEFLIGHGDSGGGLFIDKKLAGINSCVMSTDSKPNSSYGDESGHTRISEYVSWVNSHINNK